MELRAVLFSSISYADVFSLFLAVERESQMNLHKRILLGQWRNCPKGAGATRPPRKDSQSLSEQIESSEFTPSRYYYPLVELSILYFPKEEGTYLFWSRSLDTGESLRFAVLTTYGLLNQPPSGSMLYLRSRLVGNLPSSSFISSLMGPPFADKPVVIDHS